MDSILLIDDCDDFRAVLADFLRDSNYFVVDTPCPDEAFSVLRSDTFDLIICDLHMPFASGEKAANYECSLNVGVETIRELVWVYPWTPIVAVTGHLPSYAGFFEQALPGVPVFNKPIQPKRLLQEIGKSLAAKAHRVIQ